MAYINPSNDYVSKTDIILLDYGVRTDGQPLYQGFARTGTSQNTAEWLIYYFQYNGSNQMVSRTISYGTWSGRAGLTYA